MALNRGRRIVKATISIAKTAELNTRAVTKVAVDADCAVCWDTSDLLKGLGRKCVNVNRGRT